MNKLSKFMLGCSAIAMLSAAPAIAQDADDAGELRQKKVVVTGSYIQGTPEDAALPVDVIDAGDLKLEGNPSITELIRNLGVSSGVDGQTNQFGSNGLEGTSNINLRGLGPGRTLVLINGRRQVAAPYGIGEQAQLFVDTNMIPSAAIKRIEVLKDGAAALYGSDAIAGVVNFITNDDLSGFQIGGSYQTFDGSDGDYSVNGAYGWQGDRMSWVTSVGYNFRSEAALVDKDWAISDITENPVGGFSSLSNPGRYVVIGAAGTPIGSANDDGCLDAGGIVNPANGTCAFQFTQFDNLVEEEERYQVFSEFNAEIGASTNFHLEALYSATDVPSWKTSPSYPPQVLTSQFVPANSPGYLQYVADNPGTPLAGGIGALYIGRTFGWGGFPGTGGAQEGYRNYEGIRLAGGFDGSFSNGINWDVGLSYSEVDGERATNDTYIAGLTAALSGFGLCADPITGAIDAGAVAGQGGCEYYNPFSNAIQSNAITGQANPNFVPGLENSVALADWLTDANGTEVENTLLVFDAVVSGGTGFELPGGELAYAAGFQARREGRAVTPFTVSDLAQNPGPGGNGPFSFLAGTNKSSNDQTIYATFGELQIPVTDIFDIQLAARYEDYGGSTGSTFDPKIAAKLQITDGFALRGSAQTSYKGPTLNQIDGVNTSLQFVAPTSAFKAVDTFGDPDLKPESATSFNLGALLNFGGFSASLDYYNFDFSDPIIVEGQSAIVGAAIAALATPDTADDQILDRITFNDPLMPSAASIARIRTNITNGPDIKTSGIDLRIDQVFDAFSNSEIGFGLEASYIIEYDVDDFEIEGVSIAGGDRVGQFNRSNFSRSLPQWKGNFYGNFAMGGHNVRGVVRHIDSYDDERPAASRGGVGDSIDSHTTFDVFYNWETPWAMDLGLSVVNITDEDPPFAAFDLNYDPYTHNPFGRTFKISINKTFGGN